MCSSKSARLSSSSSNVHTGLLTSSALLDDASSLEAAAAAAASTSFRVRIGSDGGGSRNGENLTNCRSSPRDRSPLAEGEKSGMTAWRSGPILIHASANSPRSIGAAAAGCAVSADEAHSDSIWQDAADARVTTCAHRGKAWFWCVCVVSRHHHAPHENPTPEKQKNAVNLEVLMCDGFTAPPRSPRGSEGWSSKSPGSGSTSLDLILLNTSTGAQCLDGSPSGFYLGVGMTTEQVVEDNQDGRGDWVVYLQGGGLCIEPIDCLQRAKTRLGSSTRWPRRITHVSDGGEDILSSDKWNPFASAKQLALEPARMFPPPTCRLVDRSSFTSAGWQKVLIPYGSGDTYVGTQRTPNAFGVYFAGHLQVEATFAHLLRHTRFRLARSVLLCGGSAGGIGTFQHANWLAGLLDAEGMTTTTFKASPQAGAFFVSQDLVLMGEFELDVRVNAAALATEYLCKALCNPRQDPRSRRHLLHRIPSPWLCAHPPLSPWACRLKSCRARILVLSDHFFGGSTVFLDPSCTRAVPSHPHRCWSAAVHYPHISPPLYLAQNRYDRSQVQAWKVEPNEPQVSVTVAGSLRSIACFA